MKLKTDIDRLKFEKEEIALNNIKYISGSDEVGRGSLAGPLVVCSIIMSLKEEDIIEGIKDSKKLSEKRRIELDKKIKEKALAISIYEIDNEEIDKLNVLNATKKAIKESILNLNIKPDICFIDAVNIELEDYKIKSIVKGDDLSYSIACASIVAKVYRDNIILKYDIEDKYNFKKNKGYGTKEHIENIKTYGPTKYHRKTFIKNFIS